MADVDWPDETLNRLNEIAAYVRQFDPQAAAGFAARLFDLGQSLAMFPNRGRPGRNNTRELTGVAPYILIYEVVADRVRILDVRHGRQRPRA